MSDGNGRLSPAVVRRGVWIAGALSVLIGGFWLGAWLAGFGAKWSAMGMLTVKANTALAQILAGSALLLLVPGDARGWRRGLGVVFSAAILLIGSLTVCEHLFGWNLGIDQLLATEAPGAVFTASPNRMGPPASMCNTIIGIALLLIAFRRRVVAPYLGLAVCVINVVPAVGFLYGIHQFYTMPGLTHIAWPTVIALSAVGFGLILSRTDGGPMALLLRDDPGGILLRRMLPVVVMLPFVLGYLRVLGQHHGLYGTAEGTGLLVIALILVFSAMLSRSADRVSRSATGQKQAVDALESVALFPEENPNPVLRIGRDGELLYINSAAGELLSREGCKSGEAAPLALSEPVKLALSRDQVGEFDMPAPDGRVFSFICVPILAKDYANLYGRDVTKRKQAEEALQESEQRFRTMADAMPQLAWIADPDGFIFWYNQRWYDYSGTTPEQMEGWGWQSVHDPEKLPKVMERWTASIATGQPFEMEFPLLGVDGKYREFLTRGVPMKDSEGRVLRWLGTNTDVSEARELEAHKRAFYRTTILAATEGKLLVSEESEIEEAVGPAVASWDVDSRDGAGEATSSLIQMAREAGMSEQRSYEFLGCVTEAVTNVLKHAGKGTVSLHRVADDLICVVSDSGPGIEAMALPEVALTRGYSTAGTLGMGYKLMIHLADRVHLATGPEGTTVAIEMALQETPVSPECVIPEHLREWTD